MLLGVGLAQIRVPEHARHGQDKPHDDMEAHSLTDTVVLVESQDAARSVRALAFLGRHSLAFYLIHQPVLYGVLALIGPQAIVVDEAGFLAQCTTQCAASGADSPHCEASCGCVVARAKGAGRWRALALNELDEAQKSATHDDAVACYADAAR
jgi:uncharacterized membrane protein